MEKNNKVIPEIVVPYGFRLDEVMDFDDEFVDEQPIFAEEVEIQFGRNIRE